MEVIQTLAPYVAITVSIVAMFMSRRDRSREELSDEVKSLRKRLEESEHKQDRRTRHFSVQLAKHIPEYKNGVD